MGNWDRKNLKDLVIKNSSFLCGKCNTSTSLISGVDYFYFGNGIADNVNSQNIKLGDEKILIDRRDGRGFQDMFLIEEYFKGDFIAWKCEKCLNVNINEAISEKPKSIIPISNEYSEIKEISKIPESEKNLVNLIEEFYKAKNLGFNSSATLLGRKILMHICVEQKIAEEGKKFIEYVDALKNSDLVGSKWKLKIDKIRTLGNDEAHKIKIASDDELNLVSSVIKTLLTNIYLD